YEDSSSDSEYYEDSSSDSEYTDLNTKKNKNNNSNDQIEFNSEEPSLEGIEYKKEELKNIDYFKQVYKLYNNNVNNEYNENLFILISTEVSDVMLHKEIIFFSKKINLFFFTQKHKSLKYFATYNFSVPINCIIDDNKLIYYKIMFPF